MAVSIKIVRLATVCSELKLRNEGIPPALPKMSRIVKLSRRWVLETSLICSAIWLTVLSEFEALVNKSPPSLQYWILLSVTRAEIFHIHLSCSVVTLHVHWTPFVFSGHSSCSLDTLRVQWSLFTFSGHPSGHCSSFMLSGHPLCSVVSLHVHWSPFSLVVIVQLFGCSQFRGHSSCSVVTLHVQWSPFSSVVIVQFISCPSVQWLPFMFSGHSSCSVVALRVSGHSSCSVVILRVQWSSFVFSGYCSCSVVTVQFSSHRSVLWLSFSSVVTLHVTFYWNDISRMRVGNYEC
jgi:hypothetical protein